MPDDLEALALEVLRRNRRGRWTCPDATLYPHRWLWDSCFVAIGLAGRDPDRAAGELRAALAGQWSNGMVPHMVFDPDVREHGGTRLWRSRHDPRAPRDLDTSSITQPPLLAIATRRVADHLTGDARAALLADVVPRILHHHDWMRRERDLDRRGLVTLIHPWECGLDTTPPWMDALRRFPAPAWVRFTQWSRLTRLVRRFRRDTRQLPATERASDDDGLRMLALALHDRRHDFDRARLPADGSVLVEDVAFNALLAVANRTLLGLAADAGIDPDPSLHAWLESTPASLEQLWNEDHGRYCSRDVTTGRLVTTPTVAGFLALWAGGRDDRARRVVAALDEPRWATPFPVPSVAADDPAFEADRYWKGPTWVNTNWLVIQGLRWRGEAHRADDLARRTLDLVRAGGCAEYFDPVTGAPHGARSFSWSAVLALDLLSPPDSGPRRGTTRPRR